MNGLAAVQKKLDKIESEKEKVREEKRNIIRRSLIKCTKCDRNSSLSSWAFIQKRHYVRPFSCTGGDYWLDSETGLCHIICPKCGREVYLYTHPQRDRIVALVDSHNFSKDDLFKEVKERAER